MRLAGELIKTVASGSSGVFNWSRYNSAMDISREVDRYVVDSLGISTTHTPVVPLPHPVARGDRPRDIWSPRENLCYVDMSTDTFLTDVVWSKTAPIHINSWHFGDEYMREELDPLNASHPRAVVDELRRVHYGWRGLLTKVLADELIPEAMLEIQKGSPSQVYYGIGRTIGTRETLLGTLGATNMDDVIGLLE